MGRERWSSGTSSFLGRCEWIHNSERCIRSNGSKRSRRRNRARSDGLVCYELGRSNGAAGGGVGACEDTVFVDSLVPASALDTVAGGRLPARALDTKGSAAVRDTVDVTTLATEAVGEDDIGAEVALLLAMGSNWKVGEDGGLRSVRVIFWKLSTKIPATWE